MGGSFNPIHVGHALIARTIIEGGEIDQLWLMVSPENPLKKGQHFATERDRLYMTELVTRHIEGVVTSGFELTLPRPSYTINTLNSLRERFPDDEFCLVIGSDNWAVWDKWKSHDEILEKFKLLIYPRRGYDVVIPDGLKSRVEIVDAPIIEISSTQVRERVGEGKSIKFLVPDEVEEYINKRKLYRK